MHYQILILKHAKRQLEKLPVRVQENIAEGIAKLGINPDDPALDIKKLTHDTEGHYRLRIGNYRVKYDRDDEIRILEITRVGHRKDVYR